ncbi:hypothetical protein F53441_902 [Fusarium austroafricanum]|uniref:NACHT domain-containing protein n=1 Tax=Fusarium austroafricanum TaxID=2364996 RepID=A0A8H4KWS7_9HYPO|nr:hypothetical protein F53441_902 [Fusarium austroafricanum]
MSGAEVLFGVGILCNAMQIITFGRDALQIYQHVRDGGAPDPSLDTYLDEATANHKEMKEQFGGPRPLNSDHQQIVNIGEEAHNSLLALRQKFNKLHVDESSRRGLRGKIRVAKSGLRTLWHSKDLEDLEKTFQRHEQLLQTRLIHRVCSQADATELLSQESFKDLNNVVQHAIKKISEGQTAISVLVSQQAAEIKTHVEQQHQATRSAVAQHLSVTQSNIQSRISESTSIIQEDITSTARGVEDKKRHGQLLASLRYPEMNSRRNQVEANYPKTFQWIFRGKGTRMSRYYKKYSTDSTDSTEQSDSDDESSAGSDERTSHRSDTIEDTDCRLCSSSQHTPFVNWLKSDSKIFWISGKPASGKSTLMKFIIKNPLTVENLEIWHSNVQILTHYFWMAGTTMEKSIRGMMLSLLHQVLLNGYDLGRKLLEEKPFVREKWSHQDWASQELEEILCWALESHKGAFCIFLDGLDESPELEKKLWGPDRHGNSFDSLIKLERVKICASSREEETFCTYFEGVERLRIHKLTKSDIRRFANQRLKGLDIAYHKDREELLHHVLKKADGVFLWVALVLDSISRGARLGSSTETLIQRVKHTPTDMKQLFEEMWKRSGNDGDMASYQACSSRYFNFAVFAAIDLSRDFARYGSFSVLDFAIASGSQSLESLLDASRDITVDGLVRKCSKTEAEIRIACHGLLELSQSEPEHSRWVVPEDLRGYERKQVQFVHRCAIDFLTDTETGSMLLGACGWSKEETNARFLGNIMIKGRIATTTEKFMFRSRIVTVTEKLSFFDETIENKRYMLQHASGSCLDTVNDFIYGLTSDFDESPYKEYFIQLSRQWQLDGVFLSHAKWTYPGQCLYFSNPLEMELLESVAKTGSASVITRLLEELPTKTFLDAIPVIIRGLSSRHPLGGGDRGYLKTVGVIKAILTRLLTPSESGTIELSNESQIVQRSLTGLLFSWFFLAFSERRFCYRLADDLSILIQYILEILRLFTMVMPNYQDWDRPVSLHLHLWANNGVCYLVDVFSTHFEILLTWDCYATTNRATAYRIMRALSCETATRYDIKINPDPIPEVLENVALSFEPLIVRIDSTREDSSEDLSVGWQDFFEVRPDEQDDVAAILLNCILTGARMTEQEQLLVRGLSSDQGPRRKKGSRRKSRCYELPNTQSWSH